MLGPDGRRFRRRSCLELTGRNAGGEEGGEASSDAPVGETDAAAEVEPLKDITNENASADNSKTGKKEARPPRRERGPPADGILQEQGYGCQPAVPS